MLRRPCDVSRSCTCHTSTTRSAAIPLSSHHNSVQFVYEALLAAIEASSNTKHDAVVALLSHAAKGAFVLADQITIVRTFSVLDWAHIAQGFKRIYADLDDLSLDVPRSDSLRAHNRLILHSAAEQLAELVKKSVAAGVLTQDMATVCMCASIDGDSHSHRPPLARRSVLGCAWHFAVTHHVTPNLPLPRPVSSLKHIL